MNTRRLASLIVAGGALGVVVAALVLSQPPPRDQVLAGATLPPTSPVPVSPLPAPTVKLDASASPASASPTGTTDLPSPTATVDTCCLTVPTPVAGERLAESDAFWDTWSDFPFDGTTPEADSLQDDVDLAHLVVRGHITDIYIGEEWLLAPEAGTAQLAYARVAIGEVLKGTPASRNPGFVEVYLGHSSASYLDELRADLPQHDSVWFLLHDVTVRPRTPANESEIAPFAYFPLNDLQGVLRNINGKVKIIHPDWTEEIPAMGPNHFPLALQNASFEGLVQRLREIGETAPRRDASRVPIIGAGSQ